MDEKPSVVGCTNGYPNFNFIYETNFVVSKSSQKWLQEGLLSNLCIRFEVPFLTLWPLWPFRRLPSSCRRTSWWRCTSLRGWSTSGTRRSAWPCTARSSRSWRGRWTRGAGSAPSAGLASRWRCRFEAYLKKVTQLTFHLRSYFRENPAFSHLQKNIYQRMQLRPHVRRWSTTMFRRKCLSWVSIYFACAPLFARNKYLII